MRRLAMILSIVVIVGLIVPAGASATYYWFNYARMGSITHGRINFNCSITTCSMPFYRAGSGSGTNACQANNWIPLGTYSVPFHNDHYAGSLIQGRVWRLSDYQCSNGVRRTQLFVHSEETASNGQSGCYSGNGDGFFCWESTNDYYSQGCIKVARQPVTNGYSDLGRLDYEYHLWGHALDWVQVWS